MPNNGKVIVACGVYTLIVEIYSDKINIEDILTKMIKSVMSLDVKIEIGPFTEDK